ncbi:hypothetical protein BDQ17DRAFT_1372361 [Cyathus striatus]|nr:hypothetical protein BDQ17DRAFT_1372361 [Cyathus striatus]
MNSERDNDQYLQYPTNGNNGRVPGRSVSSFAYSHNVTISGGTYNTAGRSMINVEHGDSCRHGTITDQYGTNTQVDSFNGFSGTINASDGVTVNTVGGAMFTEFMPPPAPDNMPPTTASVFRGAQVTNLNLTGDVANIGGGSYNVSPEHATTVYGAAMYSRSRYTGEMTASVMESTNAADVTLGGVQNITGDH